MNYAELFQAQGEHKGFLVAVWLDAALAGQLAQEGYESPEGLHITLCYCGDVAEMDDVTVAKAVAAVGRVAAETEPMTGQIAGVGRFNATVGSEGQDVIYASVDVPGLEVFRQELVEALVHAGCGPKKTHGYTPHITLAYVPEGAVSPIERVPTLPMRISAVSIALGDLRAEIRLGGADTQVEYRFAEWSTAYVNTLPDSSFLYISKSEATGKDEDGRTVPRSARYFPVKDANGRVDLPHVRNAIARIPQSNAEGLTDAKKTGLQNQARGLLSASEGEVASIYDIAAEGGSWRLFVGPAAAALAVAPEWIPLLPKPGKFKHPVYGDLVISHERNQNFVGNFKAGVYQERLPIDAEHETKLSGAMGWIVDMRMNEDGGADARVEWTQRGTSLLADDRFKYISPEWYDEWTDPATETVYKDVAIGAALTTRPFFKANSLRPLVASEQGLYIPDDESSGRVEGTGETVVVVFQQVQMKEKVMADEARVTDKMDPKEFGELKAQFTELTAKVAASEAAAAEAEQEKQQYREALDKSNERIAMLESERRHKAFTETVKGWYGEAEKNVAMLEKMADAFGEASEEFTGYVAQQSAQAVALGESKLLDEIGSSREAATTGVISEVNKMAAKRVTDAGIAFKDALSQVFAERPDLYDAYRRETETRVG
jgi:2'-5' RNA ligase